MWFNSSQEKKVVTEKMNKVETMIKRTGGTKFQIFFISFQNWPQ